MQLSELKVLLECEAIKKVLVTHTTGGWLIMAIKKEHLNQSVENSSLELARGGKRYFKTLDAVYKVMSNSLGCPSFFVC